MENTIIHPTDFSSCANNALEYAVRIAKALNLKILLVHSLDLSDFDVTNQNAHILLKQTEEIEQKAEKKLQELAKQVQSHKIECRAQIFNGRLGSWLPEHIKSVKPKFVVMGTTGSSNITNKIIGSNTFSIIKEVSVPTLAVPLKAKIDEFDQFVFSTDYRDTDISAITSITKIAEYYNASVDVVHILNSKSVKNVNKEKLIENLEVEVSKKINYKKIKYQLLFGEDVHERLQILTKEIRPDFLALVMRKQNFFERLFFGSLTEKLAYHSETPIFIFPNEN